MKFHGMVVHNPGTNQIFQGQGHLRSKHHNYLCKYCSKLS